MGPSGSVRLSPLAEQDLANIWIYSATQWSPGQADTYVGELISTFSALAASEFTGTPTPVRQTYLRFLVASHAIYYRARPDGIDVIRILHQSMDVARHL